MRWTDEEIKQTIYFLQEGKTYSEISNITGRPRNAIRVKMGKLGEGINKYKEIEFKKCLNCDDEINGHGLKFCSSSCSAIYNNKLRNINKLCVNCDKLLNDKRLTCCSYKCDKEYKRKILFEKIESGDTTLGAKNYKKYLINIYGEKCMECGWDKINPTSGKIPIELEHIDGDSDNNSLGNFHVRYEDMGDDKLMEVFDFIMEVYEDGKLDNV